MSIQSLDSMIDDKLKGRILQNLANQTAECSKETIECLVESAKYDLVNKICEIFGENPYRAAKKPYEVSNTVPLDIVEASMKVEKYFAERNIMNWRLGGCASQKYYAGLLKPVIDVIIYCPRCMTIHVDEPDLKMGWSNTPHHGHLCKNCGYKWQASQVILKSEVYTNGVAP